MASTSGALPESHLLSLPRPNPVASPNGAIDTTTLAAHDFDVDNRTGFMPPQPPVSPLPPTWSAWEDVLADAQEMRLELGESDEGTVWRESVRTMDVLPTRDLCQSELFLRRAHHVLAWTLHFYVHTRDGAEKEIVIPRSLSVPLLRVCAQLQLPPVLTYSDNVLYNWEFDLATPPDIPTPTTPLRCQTLFTHTATESIFYLVSARIELIGVHALDLMRATMDELFVSDDIAVRRITEYLGALQPVIKRMKTELLAMKEKGCDPETFFNRVRPWLRGCEDAKWVFEGLDEAREEEDEAVWEPVELSGPSAGQSSLIHALDIFLGVDKWSHSVVPLVQHHGAAPAQPPVPDPNPDTIAHTSSFLTRMQQYMPRHHRHFLHHLATCSNLREFVIARSSSHQLVDAYNGAIVALKEFRDAHLIIVALFIVGPAARARKAAVADSLEGKILKGTGGTDIVQFLKTVRDQTRHAVL
ncbi:tryptophan 2,3-dioxygenase [Amanita muscaria]